jgi:choline dehydrogenase-like flavoprotein
MAQSFDAVVIGTGFGGAVTSCRLAQAGLRTLVLERGRRYDLASLPDLPRPGQLLPDPCRWMWSDSQGLWDLRDLDTVLVAQSAAYGGGSLVYANVHLRPPREVFKEGWPEDCKDRHRLDRYYDLVGCMLAITPVPEEWREIGKVKVMAKAFRDTGEAANVFFPPLAITFPKEPQSNEPNPPTPAPERKLPLNRYHRHQGECERCGACDFGCRYGAKNTLDRNYLAVAEESRCVTIQTLCEALIVSTGDHGDGYQVTYLDHLTCTRRTASAEHVFLCGGSINTTELLLRSFRQHAQVTQCGGDPNLGRGLAPVPDVGANYFINADALALVADTKRETFPSGGPVITTALVYDGASEKNGAGRPHRHHSTRHRSSAQSDSRSWFLIEDGGYPLPLEALTAVFKSPLLLGRNQFDTGRIPPLTTIGGAAVDTPPDRYASFLDGLHAAFEADQLRDVLPQDVEKALEDLRQGACRLRDEELGDLAEDVRDAVLASSWLFRKLKALHVDTAWPWAWQRAFKLSLQFMGIGRDELLANTLGATHNRYGVDTARGLPARVVHALLGEPYPVNPPKTSFPRDPRPRSKPASQTVLLAMGRDDAPAQLGLNRAGHVCASFPAGGFPTLGEEERVMRGVADQLGGTLRTSPLWALARRPITAHSHGGCALGAVTDEWGQVRGHQNLFINDGSLLPRPVGVNPSSTIAAIAERNIEHFVIELKGELPAPWQHDIHEALRWRTQQEGVSLEPPTPKPVTLQHESVGFAFAEEMRGRMVLLASAEKSRLPPPGRGRIPLAAFLSAEGHHNGDQPGIVRFGLNAEVRDIGAFLEDEQHRVALAGKLCLPAQFITEQPVEADIEDGTLALLVPSGQDQRLMTYHLPFQIGGDRWTLIGRKEIQNDPGFDAWLDASTLYVEICPGAVDLADVLQPTGQLPRPNVVARGILRLGLRDFAVNQLRGMRTLGITDPARKIWTLGSFGVFFFGQVQGVFAPEIDQFLHLFGRGFWRSEGQASEASAVRGLGGLR